MKKLLFIILYFFWLNCISFSALAKDGTYFGSDLVLMDASFKYFNKSDQIATNPIGKFDDQAIGLSGFFGYKKNFYVWYLAPEIFYDYLNLSTKDYYKISDNFFTNTIELRSRLGLKVNFGYDFSKKLSSYLTYGYVSLNYINRYPAINQSSSSSKLSDIYGAGIIYNLNDNWSLRGEFNRHNSDLRYRFDGPSSISKLTLNTLKAGIVFSF